MTILSPDQIGKLRSSWIILLQPFGARFSYLNESFDTLARRYSEDGRYHHTLAHVFEVVTLVQELNALYAKSENAKAATELAGWLHDVVYDPKAADNVPRSADLSRSWLEGLRVPRLIVAETHRLILITEDHQFAPDDRNAASLVDADLAILGAPSAKYEHYRLSIRREYAHVPPQLFCQERLKILKALYSHHPLFSTPVCRATLEAPARVNLAQEIKLLKKELAEWSQRDSC